MKLLRVSLIDAYAYFANYINNSVVELMNNTVIGNYSC